MLLSLAENPPNPLPRRQIITGPVVTGEQLKIS